MITLLEPGLFTSVQDGGRTGYSHLGVPRAGAADLLSLSHANLLVGNTPHAAALEMTLAGPDLRFEVDTVMALAGGSVEARLDGAPVAMYQSVAVRAGQILRCGTVQTGTRCYLAVAGGIRSAQVLGSACTDTLAGLGPAALQAGAQLPIQAAALQQGFYLRSPPVFTDSVAMRVILGPHQDHFTPQALQIFLAAAFRVRADSDRSGLRLGGPSVARQIDDELDSQGMLTGAVQVPADGQPIVLLSNHGATGGYPVIAAVISADVPYLGQLRPGTRVRFHTVTRAQALDALAAEQQKWRVALTSADPGLLEARALMMLAKAHPALRAAQLQRGSVRVRMRRGS